MTPAALTLFAFIVVLVALVVFLEALSAGAPLGSSSGPRPHRPFARDSGIKL